MTSEPMLAVENVFAGYEPGVPIVRGASIQVSRGEIVSVLGPNGAGKSTLIKAIAGVVPKFSGRVLLSGEDITRQKPHEMVRSGLAYVPQTENVFASMTVEENLQIAAAILPKAARRDRRSARAKRSRQVHPDQGHRRRRPKILRARSAQRRGHHPAKAT